MVNAKCNDMCDIETYSEQYYDGYVPYSLGIGGGDYISFKFCADCGKIIDDIFPLERIEL